MMACRFCEKARQLLRMPHRPPAGIRPIETLEIIIERAADGERVWVNVDRGCVYAASFSRRNPVPRRSDNEADRAFTQVDRKEKAGALGRRLPTLKNESGKGVTVVKASKASHSLGPAPTSPGDRRRCLARLSSLTT